MDDLNKRVITLEIKNKKLENDLAWENSFLKKMIESIFISLCFLLYIFLPSKINVFLIVLIPMVGYILINVFLKVIKKNLD